jgi:hypothetical protein
VLDNIIANCDPAEIEELTMDRPDSERDEDFSDINTDYDKLAMTFDSDSLEDFLTDRPKLSRAEKGKDIQHAGFGTVGMLNMNIISS